MKLTLTCLFVLTLAVTESKAQKTQATQMDVAARECHRMLVGFYDKEMTYFQTWGSDKSMDTLAKIETCAKDSYPQLTKRDLAVPVVISNWLNNYSGSTRIV